MDAGRRVDKLHRDAHAARGATDAAFEHVANAEFASDLADVDDLAFVGEARVPGDDEQRAHPRQRHHNLFDDPVGEEFLLRVAAQGGEGQHRDRRFVRQ